MNTAVLFAVTVLVNALWQPALIAGIAWAALKISRCNNATTRHAVWSLALVASFIVPFISAMPIVLPHHHVAAPITRAQQAEHLARREIRAAHVAVAPSQPALALTRPSFKVQPTIAQIATTAWLVVALAILGRLLISLVYLNRLKHNALPLAVESRNALTRYDRAHKGDRDVRICVSDAITVPVAVGIFDAMILVPSDLVHELDPNDLDRILLHELAHVRRSDDWINLFERVAQALFFFSPGIYWISRQMDLEREVACDDWVLEQSAENVPYARCLARVVEMTQWPYRAPAAPGVFVTRKSMSIRIERLLARGRDIRVRLALLPSLLALTFILVVVIAGGFVSPTIAYTLDEHVSTIAVAARPQTHRPPHAPVRAAFVPAPSTPEVLATPTPQIVTRTVTKYVENENEAEKVVQTTAVPASIMPFAPPTNGLKSSKVVADESYIDDLAAAGYKNLSPDDLIALKSLGIDGAYIRELQNAGLPHPSVHDLLGLKSLGVDGSYISQMRAAGLTDLDARSLEGLKSLGVDGNYISQMRSAGLSNLTARNLEGLKSLGVDGAYISQMNAAGFSKLDAHDLEGLKSLGVDGSYVSQMRSAGLTDLNAHDLEGLKSLGVDGAYISDLANAGYPHLSSRDYKELKSLSIDGAYIRNLRSHGFNNLTVRQLEEFKSTGVEPK
jgi:beta-lactamase regulating signal transducer with metallopeptidase domain